MKKQLRILSLVLLCGGALNAQSSCDGTVYSNGEATYYVGLDQAAPSSRSGHCSFLNSDVQADNMYGAMYTPVYANSAECGVCLEVTGLAGTKIIEIVDECPTCEKIGDIDLGQAAFEAIVGPLSIGKSPIQWFEVACPWGSSPVTVATQGTPNQWYGKVIIGKHKNRIKKVEIYDPYSSSWVNMVRGVDNGWETKVTVNIPGTTQVRITDVFDQVLTVDGIDIATTVPNTFQGTSNFTACLSTDIANYEAVRNVSIYPNPVNDITMFDDIQGIKTINIYNVMGELVRSEQLSGAASKLQFNFSNLAAGSYTVQLSNDSRIVYSNTLIKM